MHKKTLQNLFCYRKREEVLAEIQSSWKLNDLFISWNEEQKETFLDICTGQRGVKILFDSFFKEVFNPEYNPQRLSRLLSLLLKKKVRVLKVLPNDTTRITVEPSFLITDIVVEFEDGSIANIEVQKIGYRFPGERAACYSADLLLRQYKRVKDRDSKNFNYKNIRPVHVIVFFEHSPKEFHAFPDTYLHSFHAVSDTKLEMNLLQNFLFVPLDIFHKTMENKDINTELEAWLTFLSTDDPEQIYNLIQKFPMFKEMYEDIFQLCQNTERVMNMYSKELAQLDHNTAEYMVDEMQKDLDEARSIIRANKATIQSQSDELKLKDNTIQSQSDELKLKDNTIQSQSDELKLKEDTIQSQSDELKLKEDTIQSQSDELAKAYALIDELQKNSVTQ